MSTSKKRTPIILIIDDDPEFHQNMVFAFSEYTLLSTYEEKGAKAIVNNIAIDLVLSDLNLDDSSEDFKRGKKLIKWIAKKNSKIPIIAVTNYYEQREQFHPIEKLGAISILFKKDYDKKNWKKAFEEYL